MSKSIRQKYEEQPGWAKGIIGVTLVAGGAYIVYKLYTDSKKKKDLDQANQAAKDSAAELPGLIQLGQGPTYTDSQYESYCQVLVQAMNGCGTDEDSIYEVFSRMNNKADVLKLIDKFGVRFYQPCAASQPLSYARWLWDDQAYGGGLPTWLGYDLESSEIQHINAILQAKGIPYTF